MLYGKLISLYNFDSPTAIATTTRLGVDTFERCGAEQEKKEKRWRWWFWFPRRSLLELFIRDPDGDAAEAEELKDPTTKR